MLQLLDLPDDILKTITNLCYPLDNIMLANTCTKMSNIVKGRYMSVDDIDKLQLAYNVIVSPNPDKYFEIYPQWMYGDLSEYFCVVYLNRFNLRTLPKSQNNRVCKKDTEFYVNNHKFIYNKQKVWKIQTRIHNLLKFLKQKYPNNCEQVINLNRYNRINFKKLYYLFDRNLYQLGTYNLPNIYEFKEYYSTIDMNDVTNVVTETTPYLIDWVRNKI